MSNQVDPKDPNLMMSYVLTVAAMAVKLRNIEMQITSKPGILDEDNRIKMLEALARTNAASQVLLETLVREEPKKPQEWGPCPKCGGTYRFELLGPEGMDAFCVTKVICTNCNFTVHWQDDPDQSAPAAWRRASNKAASDKMAEKMQKLQAAGPPTAEEVDLQMRSSAEFKNRQDEMPREDLEAPPFRIVSEGFANQKDIDAENEKNLREYRKRNPQK